jgi:hypothetical protein
MRSLVSSSAVFNFPGSVSDMAIPAILDSDERTGFRSFIADCCVAIFSLGALSRWFPLGFYHCDQRCRQKTHGVTLASRGAAKNFLRPSRAVAASKTAPSA